MEATTAAPPRCGICWNGMEINLELEHRHSDWGDDAGGYTVLRFNGEWVGRVDGTAAKQMIDAVAELKADLAVSRQTVVAQVEDLDTATKSEEIQTQNKVNGLRAALTKLVALGEPQREHYVLWSEWQKALQTWKEAAAVLEQP